jgi:hypothetical protein
MADVIDDSQSVEVLDESTLIPLGESEGVLADDPDTDRDGDHEEFNDAGNVDEFDLAPGEVPGQDTMPGGFLIGGGV